jgi:hypothetical protein
MPTRASAPRHIPGANNVVSINAMMQFFVAPAALFLPIKLLDEPYIF